MHNQGIASDPWKTSFTRRMQVALEPYAHDNQLNNATTLLLKMTEHTWGGSSLHNASYNWSNPVLQIQLKNGSFDYDIASFAD